MVRNPLLSLINKQEISGKLKNLSTTFLVLFSIVTCLHAQEGIPNMDTSKYKTDVLEEITITSSGLKGKMQDFTGAVSIISEKKIKELAIPTVGDALRFVPGANYVDEDGRGLKPGIGLRGMDPSRNTHTLVLINGKIPIGQSYVDKGGYYMMPLGAIQNIEVIKGGSPVLYGSGSIGGIVNLITKSGSAEPYTRIKAQGGNYGSVNLGVETSGSAAEGMRYYAGYHRRQSNGFRESRSKFNTDDLTLEVDNQMGEKGKLSVFFNYFNEHSQTPGGLTQKQWEDNPRQTVNPYDFFESHRLSGSVSYEHRIDATNIISSSIYGSFLKRDWWMDNRNSDTAKRAFNGALRDIPTFGAMIDFDRHNDLFGHKNRFLAGFRLHTDVTHENSITNKTFGKKGGTSTSTNANSIVALEGFLYDEFHIVDNFKFVPGIRYTNGHYGREQYKTGDWTTSDIGAWTYSLGAFYKFSEDYRTFFTYSRGYQLPRFRDAFSLEAAEDLGAETSNNYEIGIRTTPADWLMVEIGAYIMDFDHKIIREAGVLKNAGEAYHRGIEMELAINPVKNLTLYGTGALQKATFVGGETDKNILPYAPQTLATYGIRYDVPISKSNLALNLYGNYVGKQYTDALNTETGSEDGFVGAIPEYNIVNATVNYTVGKFNFNMSGLNLLDKNYFTNRHKSWGGIMPAALRSLLIGVEYTF